MLLLCNIYFMNGEKVASYPTYSILELYSFQKGNDLDYRHTLFSESYIDSNLFFLFSDDIYHVF